jgi:hypothetical protein
MSNQLLTKFSSRFLQPIINDLRTVVQARQGIQKTYLNYKYLQSVIKVQVYCTPHK